MELLFLFLFFSARSMTSSAKTIRPSCPAKGGEIDIPYPFGIVEGCYAKE